MPELKGLTVSNQIGLAVRAVQAGSCSGVVAGATCVQLTPPARLWQRRGQ